MSRLVFVVAAGVLVLVGLFAGETIIQNISDSGIRGLLLFVFGFFTYVRARSRWGRSLGFLLILAPLYESMLVEAILLRIGGL